MCCIPFVLLSCSMVYAVGLLHSDHLDCNHLTPHILIGSVCCGMSCYDWTASHMQAYPDTCLGSVQHQVHLAHATLKLHLVHKCVPGLAKQAHFLSSCKPSWHGIACIGWTLSVQVQCKDVLWQLSCTYALFTALVGVSHRALPAYLRVPHAHCASIYAGIMGPSRQICCSTLLQTSCWSCHKCPPSTLQVWTGSWPPCPSM